ncbi:MAG: PaaI family thioesterase [Betaproteobacteria bacterium]|nr:PaaI family thioesterase [Betaproteobacteria bacterium]
MSHDPQTPAIQDLYPEHLAHCFGCGRMNEHGHHIRTFQDGEQTVSEFTPDASHIAVPGFVYGGVIASLVDCHSTATAAAAMAAASGQALRQGASKPPPRFVTGSLHVDYLRPTPLGEPLVVRGKAREIKGRKVIVDSTVYAGGVATARGEVVAVLMPDNFGQG